MSNSSNSPDSAFLNAACASMMPYVFTERSTSGFEAATAVAGAKVGAENASIVARTSVFLMGKLVTIISFLTEIMIELRQQAYHRHAI